MTSIRIKDIDGVLEFGLDDLVKFHGTRSICGLTVGYKVLERAFDVLGAREAPLQREAISVATAFPGPGARDAFECVTRAVSRQQFEVLKDVSASDQIAEAAFGAYYFRVNHDGATVEIGVKPGVIRDEFLKLRRAEKNGEATDKELKRFRTLQWELSNRIRDADPEQVVNIL